MHSRRLNRNSALGFHAENAKDRKGRGFSCILRIANCILPIVCCMLLFYHGGHYEYTVGTTVQFWIFSRRVRREPAVVTSL